jgi:hypothetical protein
MKGKGGEGRFEGEKEREEREDCFLKKSKEKRWVTRRRLKRFIDWMVRTDIPQVGESP